MQSIMEWLPSIPYGPEKAHGWGPETATLNWCEEDYYLTTYCAEIINTLTNFMFIILAFRGLRNCIKEGHDTIFFVSFLGYLAVGIGSFLFHSTLWYSMQLVDELSMIYTTCLLCWATFSYGRSNGFAFFLGGLLVSIAGSITAIYHYLQDPKFHQNAYAILTAIVCFRSWWMMETRIRAKDPAAVRIMWMMVVWGLGIFLGGFALWNVDNKWCGELKSWRRAVGMPWGFLAEGHGWWHLLTGIGAYYYIVHGIFLRHCLNGRQNEYELIWPSALTSLPSVRRRELQLQKGSASDGKLVQQNWTAKKNT